MTLKYQHEINNFQLGIPCPDEVKPIDETIYAYRFSFAPINHQLNFLPNVVFDRAINSPFNYSKATPEKKCKRCGSSFYLNKALAINNWNSLSDKIRKNLGYTHLAYGVLQKNEGLIREPEETSHFGFYEENQANLPANFKIMESI